MKKTITLFALTALVAACSQIEPKPFEPSSGHVNSKVQPTATTTIPELVETVPVLPEPGDAQPQERYTVVVNEVPVKELLFALARDARINVDIHPAIDGDVTINAVDQTLPQILKRISKQVDMRYEYDGDNLFISQDVPFIRTYSVDYVNMSRDTTSSTAVTTQISSTSSGQVDTGGGQGGGQGGGGGGGGGGAGALNTSLTNITSTSNNNFWSRLVANISAVLGEDNVAISSAQITGTENVIPNPEAGLITVRANSTQHEQIQQLLDKVLVNAKKQVLVQTTIVEVRLSEDYQAGIDWNYFNENGLSVISQTLAGAPVTSAASSFVLDLDNRDPQVDNTINATVSLLDEFGDTRILSSPQLMVLNNQTALLKVVENIVYFELNAESLTSGQGNVQNFISTEARTVPVGIVMSVTPYVDNYGNITLNIRPTISRQVGPGVADPNPQIPAGVENLVPEIAVREIESMLRMQDGQIGVLGGLMTDTQQDNDAGLPGIKDAGFFGNLFKTTSKQYSKTELVIFIRPLIINNPSLDGDLNEYRKYLSRDYNPETVSSN